MEPRKLFAVTVVMLMLVAFAAPMMTAEASRARGFGAGKKVELDEARCNGVTCGLCVDSCPMRAIRLLG